MDNLKAALISLGCPKNQVDAEMLIARLEDDGFVFSDMTDGSVDVVIINTCGFIDEAKKEAIENILDAAEMKNNGETEAIVVTGCLSEVYKEEILKEFPEVDAVVGIGSNGDIAEICRNAVRGKRDAYFRPKCELPLNGARHVLSPDHWAYLKIAEGCSNRCTYCAIPDIRGDFRSRKKEDILLEAKELADAGVKELIVVAQDTTRYGEDLYGEPKLADLLEGLAEIDGVEWIRILYCYPDRITDELLAVMRDNEKIVHYIDLPLQHADGKVLKLMNRTGDDKSLRGLIEKIRSYMPDVVIRTTFITGFPGEGEKEFETLAEFVRDMRFDRLGCFAYSAQEGTPAYSFENQVDEQTKVDRGENIMDLQRSIVDEKNEELMGKVVKVFVEGYDGYLDCYFGRSYMDAPEIDTLIYFTSENSFEEGDFAEVLLTDVRDYDLIGRENID
ncbi:MAG: 30S ribosomal protein S12 methylthiotransferase RimO [Clostridia bacterium]|nr:30S ribosomal protein S12 methylthiotransferase RimO [Clostridia bacterium]